MLMLACLIAGLYFFVQGFWLYRRYRVLADTPEIPLRSVAMGLVEVHGGAVGDEHLTSPVTRQPCFLYKLVKERYDRDDKGHWARNFSESKTKVEAVKFYLRDATGQVLIDPREADLDLVKTGEKRNARDQNSFDDLTEYCIFPGRAYDVTGTCVENPEAKGEHDRNLILRGANEPTFLVSSKSEKEVEAALRTRAIRYVFGDAALLVAGLAMLVGTHRIH